MHSEGILTSPCTYEAGFISRTAPGSGSGNDAGLSSLATASSITRVSAQAGTGWVGPIPHPHPPGPVASLSPDPRVIRDPKPSL